MYSVKVQNSRGEVLDLTGNPKYNILRIDGLTPPKADVSTTAISTMDGSRFNYSRLTQRNIVIQIQPVHPVEENRINLYKWFSAKQAVRFFYKNKTRDVYVDGYVESMEGSLFDNPQTMQVSIICPDAYFKDAKEIVKNGSYIIPLFEFAFAIEEEGIEFSSYDEFSTIVLLNESDVEMGMIIKITANAPVSNPKIYRRNTLESFELNFEMQKSDVIEISTIKGNKYVRLIREGVETNIINRVIPVPTWFQLLPGDNQFTYESDSGTTSMYIDFHYQYIFEGV